MNIFLTTFDAFVISYLLSIPLSIVSLIYIGNEENRKLREKKLTLGRLVLCMIPSCIPGFNTIIVLATTIVISVSQLYHKVFVPISKSRLWNKEIF